MASIKFEDKFLNPFFILCVLILWIFTFFVFYQKELKSYFFTNQNGGYENIIPEDLLIEDEWKNIYFNETKIGFSHTYLRMLPEETSGRYMIENTILMYLPVGIINTRLHLHSKAKLSSKKQLETFTFSISTNKYSTYISGEKTDSNKFKIIQKTGLQKKKYFVKIPEDIILSNFLEPTSRFKNIQLNKPFSIKTFNPLLMKQQQIDIYPKNIKQTNKGKVYILNCKYQNLKYTLWVNEQGQIIKEISPVGIKLVKTTSADAVENINRSEKISIRDYFSIPAKINFAKLNKLSALEVKLKNIEANFLKSNFSGQKIKKADNNYIILKIQKQKIPEYKPKADKNVNTIKEKYLADNPYIQTNSETVKNLSNHIIKNINYSPVNKIQTILKWISANIIQIPTFSVPSAIDVINSKMGDCNEITYLFTALTRSLNIPTKTITGLVYIDKNFQYHMWAEVLINDKWIPVDPTLNQFPCDVTHIGLIEGGHQKQIKLVNIISDLQIEILKIIPGENL